MKRMMIYFALLSIVALAMLAPAMLGQNQQYPFPGYPPQFAPSRTSRPHAPIPPRVPPNKFNRATKAVPGEYIVVLNDDTPNANVASVISALARAYGGVIKSDWGTFIKGFSVRMSEAAAIALSKDPRVLYVEENGLGELLQTQQAPTPWGLDRIDQVGPIATVALDGTTSGTYTYANNGAGVHVYVIDSGIRITHH